MTRYSFTVDSDLKIKSLSKELERICGKSTPEARGIPYFQVLPKISDGESDSIHKAVTNGSQVKLRKHRSLCFYGAVDSDITISPQKDGEGNTVGARVTIKPLPLCSVSKELKESQIFVEIGKNASGLAHGVRNPLNAIKGCVVYIREKYPNEKVLTEFTRIMEEEIQRLDTFISKFLSASVVERDVMETDVNTLLKKIEIFISLQSRANKIRSSFEYADVPPVLANPFYLEQGILNVINNAMEAMSAEGQLVVRSGCENLPSGAYVVIEVSDTGPGIAETISRKKACSDKGKGRGFGLFLTRETLQYYGGHLEVKSSRGSRTVVKMYLPCQASKKDG